jgi:hypothetical protein
LLDPLGRRAQVRRADLVHRSLGRARPVAAQHVGQTYLEGQWLSAGADPLVGAGECVGDRGMFVPIGAQLQVEAEEPGGEAGAGVVGDHGAEPWRPPLTVEEACTVQGWNPVTAIWGE